MEFLYSFSYVYSQFRGFVIHPFLLSFLNNSGMLRKSRALTTDDSHQT